MFRSPISIRLLMFSLVLGLIVATPAYKAALAGQTDSQPELPLDRGLMQRLSNFTLTDVKSGRTHTLYGYQGRKAIVLVFLGNDCPVGNLYLPRLIELEKEFRNQRVVFLGVNSNAHETEKEVAQFVAERGITFPVLKDPSNLVADSALIDTHVRGRGARWLCPHPLPRRDRRPVSARKGQGFTGPQVSARRLDEHPRQSTDQGDGDQGCRLSARPGSLEARGAGEGPADPGCRARGGKRTRGPRKSIRSTWGK